MAKSKAKLASDTAIVVAPPGPRAMIINAEDKPNPNNPHTWFPLLGDPPGSRGDRILWGVMRKAYRDRINSAHAMMTAKLRPAWSPDERAVTAVRHDMLAPADADDSFADPWLFAARIDREIAVRADGSTPLLAYATITPGDIRSLNHFHEEVRMMARELVASFGTPILAVQHAPGHAGNPARPHVHLLLSPYIVGPLGFGGTFAGFTGDKGRQIIVDAWTNRTRFV
ncbi:hypothetical protein HZF05_07345 [Sphingomonas sp. CGMCC 1.13654]|uniref:MobA/MobL protein domain-containing protein n=1 Tax=Sphingomonas chungangi TaxID=2683589 RepID=A0A838L418_9SPHN|nr:hypothetical protein [Sphingomonas chungangi]MBA2933914.1 hypothetical protein [Sphingomonas chungangi]MVW55243.1 hypothetical protein [Sphingomonas chungangi]